jgi:hypothetical protein
VRSKDGTVIAFDRSGSGQPLILVDGALCSRRFGPMPKLAPLLARHFTVYHYDRRGRNESGDTPPYSVAREVEDLEALIHEAGGEAFVYGVSSGAALALEAAARTVPTRCRPRSRPATRERARLGRRIGRGSRRSTTSSPARSLRRSWS